MSDPIAYLTFDGDCAEAMRFYQRTLGGKLDVMTNGNSPLAGNMPPGTADRVLHACLTLPGGGMLMASDAMPGMPYEGRKGFGLALTYPSVAEATKVFSDLSAGGSVDMPLEESFWAKIFGSATDRFGTCWLINGEAKPVSFDQ